jgi:hypothetical protein
MRVTQFGVQVESEVLVKGELLVTHTDVAVSSLLDHSARVNGLDDSVNSVV